MSFVFDTARLLLPSILQTDAADKNSCNFLFRPGCFLTYPVVALQNHRRESTINVLYNTRNMNQTKLQARLGGHMVQRVESVECEKCRVRWKKKKKPKNN